MYKISATYIIAILVCLLFAGNATAKSPATVLPSGKTVNVPDQAIDNSPVLERFIHIHYKKGFGKPGTECGNGVCEAGENTRKCPADCGGASEEPAVKCYDLLSKGAKLKATKTLHIHPDLDASAIDNAAMEWDYYTGASLFDGYITDESANWDSNSPDGRDEFSFGNYPEDGVIAVTVTWGYFSGPPRSREIVEFDILFDLDFSWGDALIDPYLMDIENIAVHEIGHGIGLADMYDGACSEVTMYGYSTEGETKKRDLESSDITGLQELYGGF